MNYTDSTLENLPYQADFIDNLPAYNTWIGNIARLDLVRSIINSNGYRYQGVAFPTRDLIVTVGNYATYGLPPYSQQNGTINVGRGAVLVSIAAYCSDPLGFKYGLFDEASNQDIVESGIIRADTIGSISSSDPMDVNLPSFLGPFFMDTPYVLTGNGNLKIRLNNLSSGYNIAQLLLNFAVPRTSIIKAVQAS